MQVYIIRRWCPLRIQLQFISTSSWIVGLVEIVKDRVCKFKAYTAECCWLFRFVCPQGGGTYSDPHTVVTIQGTPCSYLVPTAPLWVATISVTLLAVAQEDCLDHICSHKCWIQEFQDVGVGQISMGVIVKLLLILSYMKIKEHEGN